MTRIGPLDAPDRRIGAIPEGLSLQMLTEVATALARKPPKAVYAA